MTTPAGRFNLQLVNEAAAYTARSADNTRTYGREYVFGEADVATSAVGVSCFDVDGKPLASAVLIADGGATGVHEHSVVVLEERCYVAVGPYIACLSLPGLALVWSAKVDWATCFGVHLTKDAAALLSHGELEIAKIGLDGCVLWASSGADIFSEPIELLDDCVVATDFNGRRYRFDLATGAER